MRIAFLSCDDLSSFVVDDNFLFEALKLHWPDLNFDVISWSDRSVDWSNYSAAILRTTWDYTLKRDLFLKTLKDIENSGCAVFNPLEVVRWNSHKSYLKDLKKAGVPTIVSYFLEDETFDSLKNKLLDDQDYVLKPIVGASADSIQVLNRSKMLSYLTDLKTPSDWFIQPFMKEVFLGERSLFYFNSQYSHACKKVPKSGDFRVQEEHGGLITAYDPKSSEFEFAQSVLKTMGHELLYSRIDYLLTDFGPQLIELELIEPSLYLRTHTQAAVNFVKALKASMKFL